LLTVISVDDATTNNGVGGGGGCGSGVVGGGSHAARSEVSSVKIVVAQRPPELRCDGLIDRHLARLVNLSVGKPKIWPGEGSTHFAGMIALYNEKLDMFVDGALLSRPHTIFT
jgi:hypothetical protein